MDTCVWLEKIGISEGLSTLQKACLLRAASRTEKTSTEDLICIINTIWFQNFRFKRDTQRLQRFQIHEET